MLRKHIVGIITSCYIMRIYYMCDVASIKLRTTYSLPVPRLSKGLKIITAHLVYTTAPLVSRAITRL